MKNYPEIYWPEQCKYCKKSINTTYCARNQAFMEKLKSMYSEYLGTVDFICDYFHIDEKQLSELNQNQDKNDNV